MATNYAKEYSRELDQVFPYQLYFGALYNTPNDSRYKWVNAKTIEIPVISTTGRKDANRDTISAAAKIIAMNGRQKHLLTKDIGIL